MCDKLNNPSELPERIKHYLCSGGLFNPELAEHLEVRNLILDCRDRIELLENKMRAAHATATQVDANWLAAQSRGLQDIIANIQRNTSL